MKFVKADEATAVRRRCYFHLVDATDGITPETGEAAGQPQVSTNGAAWTNTGIGTLTALGNGRYYADLTQTLIATAGTQIETRYKSASTAESPGDSFQVVAFDPYDSVRIGITSLPNAAAETAGGLYTRGTGVGQINQDANGRVDANVRAISGDASAADNLELMYDGTGYTDDTAPASRTQVGNLAVGSSAISTIANSASITTGSQTGTYVNTHQLDGSYHVIEDAGGVTDLYYEFGVGGSGVPVETEIDGYAQGNGSSWNIYAYNWGATSWDQIGTITGTPGTTDQQNRFSMISAHVGSGVNLGLVRIRIFSTNGVEVGVDRILCSYTVVAQSVGYANGAIWVDTNASNTNTENYVDGVADNPVSTWVAALTLSSQLGITRFSIINDSSIVLSGDSSGYTIQGSNWSLDLNGQNIANAVIEGAALSGTAIGSSYEVYKCSLDSITIADGFFLSCVLGGDMILSSASDYYFDQCFSGVAGAGSPSIDLGAAVGNTNVNIRHYSGGVEFRNMGQLGTDKCSLEGFGQFILNSNCIGGELEVRGSFKKTDSTAGAVLINEIANIKTDTIHDGYVQASTLNTITLATSASVSDGAYDPAKIFIAAGAGVGQTRNILEYDGATRIAIVDRDWKIPPDTTSEYRVVSDPGREHVNEGLAQGGSSNTIILNPLASASDDSYIGQIAFLRSGTGADQIGIIISYVGATRTATIYGTWQTIPDTTTGYAMLPCYVDPVTLNTIAVDVAGLDGDAMRGTDNANTVVPDPAGTAPTVTEITADIDANSTQLAAILADTTELLVRITATIFSGITSLANWLRLLGRSDTADLTALTEYNTGGGAYDEATDSQEAIAGAGGGGAPTVQQIVDGVYDEARSAHTTVGTFGEGVASVQGAVASVTADVTTDAASRTASQADVSALATSAELTIVDGKVDTIALDVAGLDGDAMRGTDNANTVVPDPAGTAPTVTEITADIDANSTQLAAILADTDALQQLFLQAFAEVTSKPGAGAALAEKMAYSFHCAVNQSTQIITGVGAGTQNIEQSGGGGSIGTRNITDDGTTQTFTEIT